MYSAKANWNLVSEFEHPLSFQHNAEGYGIQASGTLNTKLSDLITLQLLQCMVNGVQEGG
ncbi:hypothetical protein MUGA111182_15805 [Mucilaginibacter galii]|uniref:Uncharacterized protein n=1 Tax=Mucilaginibacter galii TaxID=2005073 RepID=A0A917N149_9SPHI|nr:hypothetical protein GCM10011425_17520 [Mucilaginibacter galii]